MSISIMTNAPTMTTIDEICNVNINLPSTVRDNIFIEQRANYYSITNLISNAPNGHVQYFGTLHISCILQLKESFVDDGTNKPIYFYIYIDLPKSLGRLLGKQPGEAIGVTSEWICSHPCASSMDYTDTKYGGATAMNMNNYINLNNSLNDTLLTPSVVEPTMIELIYNRTDTRFYLKYFNDRKNVTYKIFSEPTLSCYSINFTMPVYLYIKNGFVMISEYVPWGNTESFRA